MRLPPEAQGLRWLSQAGQDLEAARILAASGHSNPAGFHAQEADDAIAKASTIIAAVQEQLPQSDP